MVNEQTNRILFLLTVVTVIALPFNVIGGLFGMNVGGIPFAGHRHGFLIVIVLAGALTVLGGIVAMRRRNW
jgi:zinc transporter